MRRGMVIVPVLLAILLMVGIGAAAYNAGENQGQQNATEQIQSAQANGQEVQVVHVVDENHGFFPGFFLFPFFLIGMFFLIGAIFRAGRWGGKGHGHGPGGPWNDEGRRRFEERAREWHQREHGGGGDAPPAPTTAA
jgi:hypothetical protein